MDDIEIYQYEEEALRTLGKREFEITKAHLCGKTFKQIAAELHIEVGTAKRTFSNSVCKIKSCDVISEDSVESTSAIRLCNLFWKHGYIKPNDLEFGNNANKEVKHGREKF